jgi:hypothetical protein
MLVVVVLLILAGLWFHHMVRDAAPEIYGFVSQDYRVHARKAVENYQTWITLRAACFAAAAMALFGRYG